MERSRINLDNSDDDTGMVMSFSVIKHPENGMILIDSIFYIEEDYDTGYGFQCELPIGYVVKYDTAVNKFIDDVVLIDRYGAGGDCLFSEAIERFPHGKQWWL